jgi:hypothetical protein
MSESVLLSFGGRKIGDSPVTKFPEGIEEPELFEK